MPEFNGSLMQSPNIEVRNPMEYKAPSLSAVAETK
jgi:hypothetical protein